MSQFKDSVGNVFHVPDALDAMYDARPGVERYDPDASTYPDISPAATAPAGSTGDAVPEFDPESPLAAGPARALDNLSEIQGQHLDAALAELNLDLAGKADEKRDRLAARLMEEVNGG